jgi:hypothetical protein
LRFLRTTSLPLETLITHRLALPELPQVLSGQLGQAAVKPIIVP